MVNPERNPQRAFLWIFLRHNYVINSTGSLTFKKTIEYLRSLSSISTDLNAWSRPYTQNWYKRREKYPRKSRNTYDNNNTPLNTNNKYQNKYKSYSRNDTNKFKGEPFNDKANNQKVEPDPNEIGKGLLSKRKDIQNKYRSQDNRNHQEGRFRQVELEDINHDDLQNKTYLDVTDTSDTKDVTNLSDEYERDNDDDISNNNHVSFNAKTDSLAEHDDNKCVFKLMDKTT